MTRLKAYASNPVERADDPDLPYVALEHIESGTGRLLPGVELETKDADDSVAHRAGDVRFGKLRPYLSKSILAAEPGHGSGELLVLRPDTERLDSRYLLYITLSRPFAGWATATSYGVKMPRTSWEALASFEVNVPSLTDQSRIVEFLDTETGRIDDLIAAEEKLAGLLRERELSRLDDVIAELVAARGVIRFGHLVREVDERIGDDNLPPLLSVSIHHGVIPREDATDKPPRADDFAHYKCCREGDLILNRLRAFQGGVGRSSLRGIVSPDYTVLRPTPLADGHFLHFLMRSAWFIGQMTFRVRGIGQPGQGNVRTPRVNWSDLRLIPVPDVSVEEQHRLVDQLNDIRDRTLITSRELDHQVQLLREHRQALITAAVTEGLDALRKAA